MTSWSGNSRPHKFLVISFGVSWAGGAVGDGAGVLAGPWVWHAPGGVERGHVVNGLSVRAA
jgi:hypothetical protein